MTYLVTGGAGFIGSHVVAALAAAGESVRVIDDLSSGSWQSLAAYPTVERIEGDVRSARLAEAVRGVEWILHLAADVSVERSLADPERAHAHNATATLAVLQAARAHGVRRLVYASSSAAYGDGPAPAREDQPPQPLSPYAASKVSGEHYARAFAHSFGLDAVSLRFFNVYGPGQRHDGPYAAVIPRFCRAARRGETAVVHGDGEQTRDFVHVEDAARAMLLAARSARSFRGDVFNVGSGCEVSVNRLAADIGELSGRPLPLRNEPARQGDIRRSLADIGRARRDLGYEPAVAWRDGLRQLLQAVV